MHNDFLNFLRFPEFSLGKRLQIFTKLDRPQKIPNSSVIENLKFEGTKCGS